MRLCWQCKDLLRWILSIPSKVDPPLPASEGCCLGGTSPCPWLPLAPPAPNYPIHQFVLSIYFLFLSVVCDESRRWEWAEWLMIFILVIICRVINCVIVVIFAKCYPESCSETSHPGREVNNEASRVINKAHLWQPPIRAPYTIRSHSVREGKPKWDEQDPCMKIHPPQQCPSNQNQRDCSKHELKINHCGVGDGPKKRWVQKKPFVQGYIRPA